MITQRIGLDWKSLDYCLRGKEFRDSGIVGPLGRRMNEGLLAGTVEGEVASS
jgi:hypothetical protein